VRSCPSSALLASLALAGCSLGVVPRTSCEVGGDECQQAFGFGSVCGQDGYCVEAADNQRCTRAFPEDLLSNPANHRDTLVIGSIFDQSSMAQIARERAVELAVEAANDSGGVDDREFGVVFCNNQPETGDAMTRAEASVSTASYLVNELGITAIVGPSASGDTQAVFEALEGTDTLIISPSATSSLLVGIDNITPTDEEPGLLWRTAPLDTLQVSTMVEDMDDRSIDSLVVIHSTDTYGVGIVEELGRQFTGTITAMPFGSIGELSGVVGAAASSSADEIVFVSSDGSQGASFVNATVGMTGFDTKTIFLTDSAATEAFITMTMPTASGRYAQIRGTRPAPRDGEPTFEAFVTFFEFEYGVAASPRNQSFSANAHDATWLVLYAIARALAVEDSIGGTALARGLRQVSGGGAAVPMITSNYGSIITTLRAGGSVNVDGASGTLDYDPTTEEPAAGIEIWTPDDLM
jgi:ABC-type branched-subunit amino acid transport system substrate-binding protein